MIMYVYDSLCMFMLAAIVFMHRYLSFTNYGSPFSEVVNIIISPPTTISRYTPWVHVGSLDPIQPHIQSHWGPLSSIKAKKNINGCISIVYRLLVE